MKYTELKQHINKANSESFAPCYVIGGDDAYLKQRALQTFKSLVIPEYADFNLSVVSQADGANEIVDALSVFPVFDEHKLVIVPDMSKPSDVDRDILLRYLNSPNPTSILLLVFDGVEGRNLCAKYKQLQYVDCDKLDLNSIAIEVESILENPPKRTIMRQAMTSLAERTQNDMSRICTEVQKLKAYSDGEITVSDVEEMVVPNLDYAVYELTGAVSEKQADKALKVLDVFKKQGTKPYAILQLLYMQYRKMLHAELHKNDDELDLANMLGISKGALFYLKKVSKNYSQTRLKRCVDFLHQLQYDIFSGQRGDEEAVHEAVLSLLNI